MAVDAIQRLLNHPNPGFACFRCDDQSRTKGLVVPVRHAMNPPATSEDLRRIPDIPGAQAAKDFYAAQDGGLFYIAHDAESLAIFPISDWPARTEQMVESWIEEKYEDANMPYGRNDFIAFAHVDGASSHMHWVCRGPAAGQIFWWPWTMPPDRDSPPLAADFGTFLNLICAEPVRFFNELAGCYTCFSDGRTVAEWFPEEFAPDYRTFGSLPMSAYHKES